MLSAKKFGRCGLKHLPLVILSLAEESTLCLLNEKVSRGGLISRPGWMFEALPSLVSIAGFRGCRPLSIPQNS